MRFLSIYSGSSHKKFGEKVCLFFKVKDLWEEFDKTSASKFVFNDYQKFSSFTDNGDDDDDDDNDELFL